MPVLSIGKIGDIFAHQGVDKVIKGKDNMALVDALLEAMTQVHEGLLFVNLVDFDSLYGHRRDVAGYAHALEQLDLRIAEIEAAMGADDLLLVTADHGCDPTMPGSDHTREHVPVVFVGSFNGKAVENRDLGLRHSFADMGQTLALHLQVQPLPHGEACQLN